MLKAEWQERAVGDEQVRREYWRELKEGLQIEETTVRQRNARLADQQLKTLMDRYQQWLDDDKAINIDVGEQISKEFGQVMERMPSQSLARSARYAVDEAARRITTLRTAIAAHVDMS